MEKNNLKSEQMAIVLSVYPNGSKAYVQQFLRKRISDEITLCDIF